MLAYYTLTLAVLARLTIRHTSSDTNFGVCLMRAAITTFFRPEIYLMSDPVIIINVNAEIGLENGEIQVTADTTWLGRCRPVPNEKKIFFVVRLESSLALALFRALILNREELRPFPAIAQRRAGGTR